jgi:uncharacterized protein YcbK (DUF882 family)
MTDDQKMSNSSSRPGRRAVLGGVLALGTSAFLPSRARSRDAAAPRARWLELASTHTGEVLSVAYRGAAGLVDDAVQRLQHLLRDHRNGAQHPMDTGLYDLLADLAERARVEPRYEIISGYRSPASNAMLHERSAGVAVRSLHLEGRAIDVRLKGVRCEQLAALALSQQRGGVGFYRRADFVHVDTGRIRHWQG